MITESDWRSVEGVPEDIDCLAVMDGECGLCSHGARRIARWDTQDRIRICTVGSDLGTRLMHHHGLDPDDPESWLFLEGSRAHTGADGFIAAGRVCGGVARLVGGLAYVPRPLRNWGYVRVARNRYAIFGRRQMCTLPDPALRSRFLG